MTPKQRWLERWPDRGQAIATFVTLKGRVEEVHQKLREHVAR